MPNDYRTTTGRISTCQAGSRWRSRRTAISWPRAATRQRRPATAERDRRIHGGRALRRAKAGRHRSRAAFGQAFGRGRKGQPQFAAVDDDTNTATVWTLRSDHDNAQW